VSYNEQAKRLEYGRKLEIDEQVILLFMKHKLKGVLNRELRANVFLGLGPAGPGFGAFFTNIQHPVCTWIDRDHDLTTYN